ncbi:Map microtubule affinity-regulating kinase [Dinochytrium kinnereticum]|nr:Map microtubule affinity-regulating kinase [Dinochytrium kinnereticum]
MAVADLKRELQHANQPSSKLPTHGHQAHSSGHPDSRGSSKGGTMEDLLHDSEAHLQSSTVVSSASSASTVTANYNHRHHHNAHADSISDSASQVNESTSSSAAPSHTSLASAASSQSTVAPQVRLRPRPVGSTNRERPISFAGVPSHQILPEDRNAPRPVMAQEMHSTAAPAPRLSVSKSVAVNTNTVVQIPIKAPRSVDSEDCHDHVSASQQQRRKRAATVGIGGSGRNDSIDSTEFAENDPSLITSGSGSGSQLSISERIRTAAKIRNQKPEPRTLRFTFSVSTTSSKEPDFILSEIIRVLDETPGVKYDVQAFICICTLEDLEFEIEVCKLPRLSVNGLRFKRLAGNSWNYKNLLTDIISKMNI